MLALGEGKRAEQDFQRARGLYREKGQEDDRISMDENIALARLLDERWGEAYFTAFDVVRERWLSSWGWFAFAIAARKLGENEVSREAQNMWREIRTAKDEMALRELLPDELFGLLKDVD